MKKICIKCKIEKNIEEFHLYKKSKDNHNNTCIECRRIISLNSYRKNYSSLKMKKINESRKEKKSKWYYKDKENNLEKYKEKWEEQNKKRKKIKALWFQINKKKVYQNLINKRKNSVKLRIDHSISSGILKSIKKNKKSQQWEKLLGYTLDILIKHLIKNVPEGYLLEDYGSKLHIDHIIQVVNFNYNSYEDAEFKKCWNYRNLRLLESIKNMSRSDKIDKNLVLKYNIIDLLPEGIKIEDL